MLNSDGELEEDQETHAERHARTIALAQVLDFRARPISFAQLRRIKLDFTFRICYFIESVANFLSLKICRNRLQTRKKILVVSDRVAEGKRHVFFFFFFFSNFS